MGLRIDILTLFCEMFDGFLATSIVGRAVKRGLVDVHRTNIRDFAPDAYGKVDDAPFGGGPGMVLMCQPIFDAVESVRSAASPPGKVVLLTPQGRRMDQDLVKELSGQERLILIAGHYEGFDERIHHLLKPREISIGDYVLSGGELPAMVLMDAVVRLIPGVLGDEQSPHGESFGAADQTIQGGLEYPQYTRPREFQGVSVPEILFSGNHAAIEQWRREQSRKKTAERRPDLLN